MKLDKKTAQTATTRRRGVVAGSAVGALVATVFAAQAWTANAAPGDDDATLVPIAPCRLADTRDAPDRVNDQDTFGAGETATFAAHGSNGDCTLPTDAIALSLTVTSLGATAPTFVTVYPGGPLPVAANLNPQPGQPPTPSAVVTGLSDAGTFDVFNLQGDVDLVIDVNGYYTPKSLIELNNQAAATAASVSNLEGGVNDLTARVEAIEPDVPFTNTPFLIELQDGETQQIAANGPISMEAVCSRSSSTGRRTATISAATSEDDQVIMSSDEDDDFDGTEFLLPSTPLDDAEMFERDQSEDGTPDIADSIDGGYILTASGEFLSIDGETLAIGVEYNGNDCIFAGTVTSFVIGG